MDRCTPQQFSEVFGSLGKFFSKYFFKNKLLIRASPATWKPGMVGSNMPLREQNYVFSGQF